ncbi:MAG TPA: hypothetical protein VMG38_20265 [Trebonia sp.]|nr:hypothetical protein [Trebonia sp.]
MAEGQQPRRELPAIGGAARRVGSGYDPHAVWQGEAPDTPLQDHAEQRGLHRRGS